MKSGLPSALAPSMRSSLANFEDIVAQHNTQQGRVTKTAEASAFAGGPGAIHQRHTPRWLYKGI